MVHAELGQDQDVADHVGLGEGDIGRLGYPSEANISYHILLILEKLATAYSLPSPLHPAYPLLTLVPCPAPSS